MKKLSPSEFIDAFNAEAFFGSVKIQGLAKVVHSESIAITTNPKANQWVEIPHEMIEYSHHIDTSVGEFVKLPFVDVVFKDPTLSNPEASV